MAAKFLKTRAFCGRTELIVETASLYTWIFDSVQAPILSTFSLESLKFQSKAKITILCRFCSIYLSQDENNRL